MTLARIAQRTAWACLAGVLMLAPLLGLMHGLVHGPEQALKAVASLSHGHGAHGHAEAHAGHAADDHDHAHAAGWLADLFSVHADDSDCRVYDQLCHSDVVPAVPMLALPMALSSFSFHFLAGQALARRAALFEARGPPLTR